MNYICYSYMFDEGFSEPLEAFQYEEDAQAWCFEMFSKQDINNLSAELIVDYYYIGLKVK